MQPQPHPGLDSEVVAEGVCVWCGGIVENRPVWNWPQPKWHLRYITSSCVCSLAADISFLTIVVAYSYRHFCPINCRKPYYIAFFTSNLCKWSMFCCQSCLCHTSVEALLPNITFNSDGYAKLWLADRSDHMTRKTAAHVHRMWQYVWQSFNAKC